MSLGNVLGTSWWRMQRYLGNHKTSIVAWDAQLLKIKLYMG